MSTGLIIGKFMPPHKGHIYLIECAIQRVSELTVIVFSRSHDPIAGKYRLCWLQSLFPNVCFFQHNNDLPVDFGCAMTWTKWIDAICQTSGASMFDYVFSSEDYGLELAARLHAKSVIVDKTRTIVPISATEIRSAPLDHLKFLPKPVVEYYLNEAHFAASQVACNEYSNT
ncbi:adenylyltransferase/cytidyltransferase family protein [Desulfobacterales bacterium HSG2]|nr:adenylyltransferase/cytidyltransferase family protein [Desulfobacterales bacterium HSG2]